MIGQGLDVSEYGDMLLAAVIEHFAANTTVGDLELPARRYVAAGDPLALPWDCEQVNVANQGIDWGQAVDAQPRAPRSGSPMSVFAMRTVTFVVSIVRCFPTADNRGTPPAQAVLDAAGRVHLRESGLLSQAVVEFASRHRQGLEPGGSVQAGTVAPVGPDGGMVGLLAPVTITAGKLV